MSSTESGRGIAKLLAKITQSLEEKKFYEGSLQFKSFYTFPECKHTTTFHFSPSNLPYHLLSLLEAGKVPRTCWSSLRWCTEADCWTTISKRLRLVTFTHWNSSEVHPHRSSVLHLDGTGRKVNWINRIVSGWARHAHSASSQVELWEQQG